MSFSNGAGDSAQSGLLFFALGNKRFGYWRTRLSSEQKDLRTFRDDVRIVIFEAGTRAGKAFDVGLIVFILASVVVVMLDSVPQIHARYGVADTGVGVYRSLCYRMGCGFGLYRTDGPMPEVLRRCRSHGYFADVAQPVD